MAELSREALGRREEDLVERIDRLRTRLAAASDGRDVVRETSEGLTALSEACDGLSRELKHAPSAYQTAACAYRDRAEDYTDAAMRAQIVGFAEDFEAVAEALPARQQELRAFGKHLAAMQSKLAEARQFLDDMVIFLESHPGFGAADPRDRYAGQLDVFARSFSEVSRLLQEFRDKLRGKAVSKVIRGQVEQEDVDRRTAAETALARARDETERRTAAEAKGRREEADRAEAEKRQETLHARSSGRFVSSAPPPPAFRYQARIVWVAP